MIFDKGDLENIRFLHGFALWRDQQLNLFSFFGLSAVPGVSWGPPGASRGPPGVLLWLRGGSSGAFLGFPVGLVERLGAFSGSLGVHVTLVPRIAGSIEFYRSKSVQDTLAWPRNSLEDVAKLLNSIIV